MTGMILDGTRRIRELKIKEAIIIHLILGAMFQWDDVLEPPLLLVVASSTSLIQHRLCWIGWIYRIP